MPAKKTSKVKEAPQATEAESLEVVETTTIEIPKNLDVDDSLSSKKIIVWTLGIILLAVLFIAGVVMAYRQGEKVGEEKIRSQIAKSPTPTATPTPQIPSTSFYKIKVLNGSGLSGEASRVKTMLEKQGYTVSDIGNADTQVVKTSIASKEEVNKGWINNLKIVLGDTYVLQDVEKLSSGSAVNVIVTIGSQKVSP